MYQLAGIGMKSLWKVLNTGVFERKQTIDTYWGSAINSKYVADQRT